MEAVVTTTKKKEDGTLHCASVGFCAYQTELCFESRLLGRLQAKKKIHYRLPVFLFRRFTTQYMFTVQGLVLLSLIFWVFFLQNHFFVIFVTTL